MPAPLNLESFEKTLDPLRYVVDIQGNQWSENLVTEVQTIEEFEQIATAQRKLMREAAKTAIDMQVNYIQVQTLLASKRAENRNVQYSRQWLLFMRERMARSVGRGKPPLDLAAPRGETLYVRMLDRPISLRANLRHRVVGQPRTGNRVFETANPGDPAGPRHVNR